MSTRELARQLCADVRLLKRSKNGTRPVSAYLTAGRACSICCCLKLGTKIEVDSVIWTELGTSQVRVLSVVALELTCRYLMT